MSYENVKALIVDDSAMARKMININLQKYNMKIDERENGKEAVEAVKSNRYGIVFMDDIMPEMTGTEAVKQIREMGNKDPYFKNLPIIAYDRDIGKKEAFIESGFNDLVTKSFEPEGLEAVLAKWLS